MQLLVVLCVCLCATGGQAGSTADLLQKLSPDILGSSEALGRMIGLGMQTVHQINDVITSTLALHIDKLAMLSNSTDGVSDICVQCNTCERLCTRARCGHACCCKGGSGCHGTSCFSGLTFETPSIDDAMVTSSHRLWTLDARAAIIHGVRTVLENRITGVLDFCTQCNICERPCLGCGGQTCCCKGSGGCYGRSCESGLAFMTGNVTLGQVTDGELRAAGQLADRLLWLVDMYRTSTSAPTTPTIVKATTEQTTTPTAAPVTTASSTASTSKPTPVCGLFKHLCANGRCIRDFNLCDGDDDCGDGSDERGCVRPCTGLLNHTCANGRCIKEYLVCDGWDDCHDGSDEQGCVCTGLLNHTCSNGHCIYEASVCDGYDTCGDGSDEQGCVYDEVCTGYRNHKCANGLCIYEFSVCDGMDDCYDGSDERGCDSRTTASPATTNHPATGSQANLACGKFPLQDPLTSRIVRGNVTRPNEWPSICTLNSTDGFCGGTLVKNLQGQFYLVTAAHCTFRGGIGLFTGSPLVNYRIRCGVHSLSGNNPHEQLFGVKKVIIHEDRAESRPGGRLRSSHDIAILELNVTVHETDYVNAACLPSVPAHAGEKAVAAGWGDTLYGRQPDLLQDLDYTITSDKECEDKNKAYSDLNCTRDGVLCANPRAWGKGTCSGDSGGPLYINRHGLWMLVGVTRSSIGCGFDEYDDVFTDVYRHLGWINSKIN